MPKSIGKLVYYTDPYKLIVDVDNDIGNYYRSLIPKHFRARRPFYDSHISVIRNEDPIIISYWNKYQDLEIEFEYDIYIHNSATYFWLNVTNKLLEEIRLELGLTATSEFSKPPDSSNYFHITIANTKHCT